MNDMNQILRKCAVVVAMLCAFVLSLSAQNTLTGRVVSENGSPLPGVFVSVKGTNNATITDNDGKFTLSADSTAPALVFQMLGMMDQEVPIGTRTSFNVVMAAPVNKKTHQPYAGF